MVVWLEQLRDWFTFTPIEEPEMPTPAIPTPLYNDKILKIDANLLKKVASTVKDLDTWVEPLRRACAQNGIDTTNKIAAFLATINVECGFVLRRENMNYSAERLMQVFPKYFKSVAIAQKYARKPEMIANRVYANRMGNGPEESGDGWKTRGAGPFQVTGRDNMTAFGESIGLSFEEVVPYIETMEGGIESAAWYWRSRNLGPLAEKGDMKAVSLKVNGGTNGMDARIANYNTLRNALG